MEERRIEELEHLLERVIDYYDSGDLEPGPESREAMETFIEDISITLDRDYLDNDTQ